MKIWLFNIILFFGLASVALSVCFIITDQASLNTVIIYGLVGIYLLFASSVLFSFLSKKSSRKLLLGFFILAYCTSYNFLLIIVFNITDGRIMILQLLALFSMALPVLTITYNQTEAPGSLGDKFRFKLLKNKSLRHHTR